VATTAARQIANGKWKIAGRKAGALAPLWLTFSAASDGGCGWCGHSTMQPAPPQFVPSKTSGTILLGICVCHRYSKTNGESPPYKSSSVKTILKYLNYDNINQILKLL